MELKRSIRFLYASVPSLFVATSVRISMSPSQNFLVDIMSVASTCTVNTLPDFSTVTFSSGRMERWLGEAEREVVDSEQVTVISFIAPRAHSIKKPS